MEIHEVYSISGTQDDCLVIDMDYTEHKGERSHAIVAYRASDIHAPITPLITQWLIDHPDQEILPYEPPPPLTPEELRALMPPLTPRQFRDILTDLGIMPPEVTAKIMEIPFAIERQKALNAWEVMTEAVRIDPYINMIGAMFEKTPEDIDVAWMNEN